MTESKARLMERDVPLTGKEITIVKRGDRMSPQEIRYLLVCNRTRYTTRYLIMIAVITVADNFSNKFVSFSSVFPVVCHHDMDEETERKKRKMMKCEE